MLLFSPCKRCPCPCSDVVLRSCEEALAGIILHCPPSLWFAWVRSGCAGLGGRGPGVGGSRKGRGAGRGGGKRVPRRRVAGPPPHPRPTPSQASRPSNQSHVKGVTPPQAKRAGADTPQHMEPQTGNHRAGWGWTTHNTGNHRAPSPMMLCTMTLMCYSRCGCWCYLCSYVALGFGTACSLLYLIENRAWLVMFLRKLYRPLSYQAKFRLGSLKVSLSTCLIAFHSGLLSKGPEESPDVDHASRWPLPCALPPAP